MPFVNCPKCDFEFVAPRELIGLNTECPKCGKYFPIETDSSDGPSRRRKRSWSGVQVGVVVAVAGSLIVAFALLLVLVAAVTGRKPSPKDTVAEVTVLRDQRIVEFIDHPERFKGQTLRAELTLDSSIHGDRGDSLRRYAGQEVRFRGYGPKYEKLILSIKMPTTGELPNAQYLDDLVVTFICRDGKLVNGNEAIKIERR